MLVRLYVEGSYMLLWVIYSTFAFENDTRDASILYTKPWVGRIENKVRESNPVYKQPIWRSKIETNVGRIC